MVSQKILYTEDNIPVRTVYLSGLSINSADSTFFSYFNVFGNIVSHRIHRNNKTNHSFAFITFATTEAAANVIKKKRHKIGGQNVYASIADSWHQPQNKNQQQTQHSQTNRVANDVDNNDTATTSTSTTTIDILNDDCLLHICQYLNIVEIIRLSQASERLRQFTENNIYYKYKILDLNLVNQAGLDKIPTISLMDIRNLFIKLREYVQELRTSCYNLSTQHDRFFCMIQKLLPNLQELQLNHLELKGNQLRVFGQPFVQLRVLNLYKCKGLGDTVLKLSPNIVELQINHINDFDGGGLMHLNKLCKLSIKYCPHLIFSNLLIYLRTNQQLVRLTLKGYTKSLSTYNDIAPIVSNLNALEYFCTDRSKYWPIDKMSGLKSLNMGNLEDRVPTLKGLTERDQLEELDISWCSYFDDNETNLHKYLLAFNNLKVLNVNYTNSINQELLLKLTKKLDLTSLRCESVPLDERATVQLVVNSKHLEIFCYSMATTSAIKEIFDLVNNDLNRPKLIFMIFLEDLKLQVPKDSRVQVIDIPPHTEDGYHDYDENYQNDLEMNNDYFRELGYYDGVYYGSDDDDDDDDDLDDDDLDDMNFGYDSDVSFYNYSNDDFEF